MNRLVLNFLKEYSFDPHHIDRLIVSSFLKEKRLRPNATFLETLHIKEDDKDNKIFSQFSKLTKFNSLEKVIEAFEFVISPKEKVVTGAVYTPLYIREFILNKTLLKHENLNNILLADIACGCGGFLMTATNMIQKKTRRSFAEIIKKNIWGLDIADYSIHRSKIILALLALENGEDMNLEYNLFIGNALNFSWRNHIRVKENTGFDLIVGNPPYVASRNIDDRSREFLNKWKVTKTGHPDLYIPFFEIGVDALRNNGTLGYITVNTFFKSINGRALRNYFSEESYNLTIIDFRGEQIFKKKSTYTCLCFIEKSKSEEVKFCKTDSKKLNIITNNDLSNNKYSDLDDFSGWNLGDTESLNTVYKIEQFKDKIFDRFSFSTGIATLKNSVYKFINIKSTHNNFTLESEGRMFEIERTICREIINANKITTEDELDALKEKLIFPYVFSSDTNKYEVIKENELKNSFPLTYDYLKTKKVQLAKRDKGVKKYDSWYAYGRNQGLQIKGIKLFLPHIAKNPKFVISKERELLFCNGEAIISENEDDLLILKRILESRIFWYYILRTSKPYSSDYFSLSKNYIKKFSIPEFLDNERLFLLEEESDARVLTFLLKKYGINKSEIS